MIRQLDLLLHDNNDLAVVLEYIMNLDDSRCGSAEGQKSDLVVDFRTAVLTVSLPAREFGGEVLSCLQRLTPSDRREQTSGRKQAMNGIIR